MLFWHAYKNAAFSDCWLLLLNQHMREGTDIAQTLSTVLSVPRNFVDIIKLHWQVNFKIPTPIKNFTKKILSHKNNFVNKALTKKQRTKLAHLIPFTCAATASTITSTILVVILFYQLAQVWTISHKWRYLKSGCYGLSWNFCTNGQSYTIWLEALCKKIHSVTILESVLRATLG